MLSTSTFWQTQHALHGKNSNALPAALLILAGVLVTYRHMTEASWEGNQLKTFLALIMIQMLPLVLIEMKISSCSDPMALLSRFGSKVLLMHAFVLGLRACYNVYIQNSYLDVCWFIGVCVALHVGCGLRLTLRHAIEHCDLLGLILMAVLVTVTEESISYLSLSPWQRENSWDFADLTISCCNYLEILAFVPAVWMVCRDKSEMSMSLSADDAKVQRMAHYFFAFLLAFYFCEDLCSVPSLWNDMPLAAIGHSAHFILVLDFAGFMLGHIYNPEKLKEGFMKLKDSFGAGTLV